MASFDNENAEPKIIIRKRRGHGRPAVHHGGGAWKIAYADFVTAMMAFFMLLWLVANPDKGRLKGLAEYFSTATVNSDPAATMTSMPGSDPGVGGRRRRAQADAEQALGEATAEAGTKGAARGGTANIPEASQRVFADEMMIALEQPPEKSDAGVKIRIDPSRDGMRINLMDTAHQSIFAGPTANLNAYGRELLTRVARKLANSGGQIAIEGHTDSVGGAQSETNWQLSGARAFSSRAAMIAAGLSADRFAEVVAKAGTQPVDADRPDRPENRRITIVVLAEPSVLPRDASFKF
jgi:chemotaxis protein MotB